MPCLHIGKCQLARRSLRDYMPYKIIDYSQKHLLFNEVVIEEE